MMYMVLHPRASEWECCDLLVPTALLLECELVDIFSIYIYAH
jgi:hypothetical protein